MLREFDRLLAGFAELQEDLGERDVAAQAMAAALAPSAVADVPLREEILALIADSDLLRARDVMDRWLGHSSLDPAHKTEVLKLNVQLLIAEDEPAQASAAADSVLAADRTPEILALAAVCAHRAGDPKRAATLMHEALDAGIAKDDVKASAMNIAGAAGDSRLVERLRP